MKKAAAIEITTFKTFRFCLFRFALISYFPVYRYHGNFDFPKNYTVSNFNPIPIPGVNFTSIRVREVC